MKRLDHEVTRLNKLLDVVLTPTPNTIWSGILVRTLNELLFGHLGVIYRTKRIDEKHKTNT